jgi:hypothetical protein
MKRFLSLIIVAVTLIGSVTGCKTTSNPSGVIVIGGTVLDPAAVGTTVRIASKLGAVATINAQPDSRQYFELAAGVIKSSIAIGDYNSTNIVNSINGLTGNELVANSIADAINLYQAFYGEILQAKLSDKSPYTVPVLQGLADGLTDALRVTAPSFTFRAVSPRSYTPPAPTPLK